MADGSSVHARRRRAARSGDPRKRAAASAVAAPSVPATVVPEVSGNARDRLAEFASRPRRSFRERLARAWALNPPVWLDRRTRQRLRLRTNLAVAVLVMATITAVAVGWSSLPLGGEEVASWHAFAVIFGWQAWRIRRRGPGLVAVAGCVFEIVVFTAAVPAAVSGGGWSDLLLAGVTAAAGVGAYLRLVGRGRRGENPPPNDESAGGRPGSGSATTALNAARADAALL